MMGRSINLIRRPTNGLQSPDGAAAGEAPAVVAVNGLRAPAARYHDTGAPQTSQANRRTGPLTDASDIARSGRRSVDSGQDVRCGNQDSSGTHAHRLEKAPAAPLPLEASRYGFPPACQSRRTRFGPAIAEPLTVTEILIARRRVRN